MTYFLWLLLFVWLPQLALIALFPRTLWAYRRTLIACTMWSLIFSVPWELWAVHTEIWIFPPHTNIGGLFLGVPLEEYLFIGFVGLFIASATVITKAKRGPRMTEPGRNAAL